MNYQRVYAELIAHRVEAPATGYTERHHIKPKCLGGNDASDNIVKLTAREHYIAHLLLARIYGGRLWMAVFLMSGRKNAEEFVNASTYAHARKQWAEAQRGSNNHAYGKPLSSEHKAALSAFFKGRKLAGGRVGSGHLGKRHSDEAKEKMSAKAKLRPQSPNRIAAVIEANKRRAKSWTS